MHDEGPLTLEEFRVAARALVERQLRTVLGRNGGRRFEALDALVARLALVVGSARAALERNSVLDAAVSSLGARLGRQRRFRIGT